MNFKSTRAKILYEIFISILALVAVIMALADILGKIDTSRSTWYWLDLSILLIFAIDYIVRLILSDSKKKFFVTNIFDLIAIIPFSSFFRAFRIARLVRLTRLLKFAKLTKFAVYIKRFGSRSMNFLRTNGLIYILFITVAVVLLGSVGIYVVENGITVNGFSDAIWWAFVTATTVGYGDISPATDIGRVIAGLLMITGIGTIGMLTGTIATYFVKKVSDSSCNREGSNESDHSSVLKDKFNGLSEIDKNKVASYIEFLHNSSEE